MSYQFVCPTWGDFTVIVAGKRDVESSAAYEPRRCIACGGVHFVSPVTGLVLKRPPLKRPPGKPEIVVVRCRPTAAAPNSSRPLRD
jgi:hypothetical protein